MLIAAAVFTELNIFPSADSAAWVFCRNNFPSTQYGRRVISAPHQSGDMLTKWKALRDWQEPLMSPTDRPLFNEVGI